MVPNWIIYLTALFILVILILVSIILWYSVTAYNTYQQDHQQIINFLNDLKLYTLNYCQPQEYCNPHPSNCQCHVCCKGKKEKKCYENDPWDNCSN